MHSPGSENSTLARGVRFIEKKKKGKKEREEEAPWTEKRALSFPISEARGTHAAEPSELVNGGASCPTQEECKRPASDSAARVCVQARRR